MLSESVVRTFDTAVVRSFVQSDKELAMSMAIITRALATELDASPYLSYRATVDKRPRERKTKHAHSIDTPLSIQQSYNVTAVTAAAATATAALQRSILI